MGSFRPLALTLLLFWLVLMGLAGARALVAASAPADSGHAVSAAAR